MSWVFWVTGATVVVAAAWLIWESRPHIDWLEILGLSFLAGFAAFMVSGVIWFFHHEITAPPPPEYTVTYPLHEIKMGSERDSTGWFLVIAGSHDSDEELKYYFYVEHPTNGTLQLSKEDAEDITFKQEPTTKPRIVCKTQEKSHLDESYEDAWVTDCVFHVPEGSISNDIDLEIPK